MKLRTEIELDKDQSQFMLQLYQMAGECSTCDKLLPQRPRFALAWPEVRDGKLYLVAQAICQSCNDRLGNTLKSCKAIQLS